MQEIEIGEILIAEPFMDDHNFVQTVILVCDYERDHGTVGFILNKPLDIKVEELMAEFPEFKAPLYYGGPVGHDTIHYVHSKGDVIKDSVPIRDGLFWGGDYEELKFLIKTGVVTERDVKFFLGYSGWSPGQLGEEMEQGAWVLDDMDNNYLLNIPSSKLWKTSLQNIRPSLAIVAEIPDILNLN